MFEKQERTGLIVKLYYKQGCKHKNILAWKDLTKDSKEFSEIRRIDFDE